MKHSMTMGTLLLLGAACCLSACGAMKRVAGLDDDQASAYPWDGAREPVQAPLLSRDGGVVAGPELGSASVTSPRHGVQTSDEGRMYIVELYQKALDERDALRGEVDGLMAALDESQREAAALSTDLERERAELARLQTEVQSISGENVELAARLATAQLRRLEAEKLLLEERLHAREPEAARGAVPAAPIAGPNARPASGDASLSAWDLALGGGEQ